MKKLFTIGYGGRSPNASDFLSILKENNVVAVVDVRLRPNRAYSGAYVKAKSENKGIQLKLKTVGIKYYSFKELGNHFMDSEDWSEKYKELLAKKGDILTRRLNEVPQPFCLLCAEKYVSECHRKLIADYLESKGWEVEHLV